MLESEKIITRQSMSHFRKNTEMEDVIPRRTRLIDQTNWIYELPEL